MFRKSIALVACVLLTFELTGCSENSNPLAPTHSDTNVNDSNSEWKAFGSVSTTIIVEQALAVVEFAEADGDTTTKVKPDTDGDEVTWDYFKSFYR